MVRPYRICPVCGKEIENYLEKLEHLKKLAKEPEHGTSLVSRGLTW